MNKQITLYTVADSPPGRAVQMAMAYLNLDCNIKEIDFDNGEHFSKEFLKKYPQGEVPLLDDNGFILGESVAINQYLADCYGIDTTFYPKDAISRGLVNYWLAFYLSTYYRRIHDYYVLPADYKYERTEDQLKKLNHAVRIFETTLATQGTKYVAGDKVTIADLSLIMATVVLQARDYKLQTKYPTISTWYKNFQENEPKLWKIAQEGLDGLLNCNKNPKDLSHLNHPIHPTEKKKVTAQSSIGIML